MTKRYSEEEIERGLVAAATLGIRPAGRETHIPEATLRRWIDTQPDRYAEIRAQEAPKWRARAAAFMEDLADRYGTVEAKIADRLNENVDNIDPKDLPKAAQQTALAKAINTDKSNVLRGHPTEIAEHRYTVPQLDQAMQALLGSAPSTTGDITDAEVVEDDRELTA